MWSGKNSCWSRGPHPPRDLCPLMTASWLAWCQFGDLQRTARAATPVPQELIAFRVFSTTIHNKTTKQIRINRNNRNKSVVPYTLLNKLALLQRLVLANWNSDLRSSYSPFSKSYISHSPLSLCNDSISDSIKERWMDQVPENVHPNTYLNEKGMCKSWDVLYCTCSATIRISIQRTNENGPLVSGINIEITEQHISF